MRIKRPIEKMDPAIPYRPSSVWRCLSCRPLTIIIRLKHLKMHGIQCGFEFDKVFELIFQTKSSKESVLEFEYESVPQASNLPDDPYPLEGLSVIPRCRIWGGFVNEYMIESYAQNIIQSLVECHQGSCQNFCNWWCIYA